MTIDVTGFNRRRRELAKRQPVQLGELSFNELRAAAKEANIDGYGKMNKAELVQALKG